MEWTVDPKNPTPIYAQVMGLIRQAIATGQLQAGDQLPTVRQLSVDLKINPNTVSRAYSEMERIGVIATRQGRGTFVRDGSVGVQASRNTERLSQVARAALVEAHALGFSSQELMDAMQAQMASGGARPGSSINEERT